MNRSFLRLLALVAAIATAGACADQSAPFEAIATPDVRVGGPFLSLSPTEHTVQVLEREVALPEDVVVTRVIGVDGGVIEVPEAGLRLSVPRNALHAPTAISVRAHAGTLVAYTFEPHGTQFAQVVSADQSLAGTVAEGSGVRVSGRGYFSDTESVQWDGSHAAVTELSLVREDAAKTSVQFYLNHFSGYLVAID